MRPSLADFAAMPERHRYPVVLTTRQAHEMLGGIGINALRDEARRNPEALGARWVGGRLRFDRDRILRWWLTRPAGAEVRTRWRARGRRSA
ncbi:MAG: hypothetical protein QJR08_03840 [Bacillota bacterium]|nr:hypothetical protein [Bacillota bacterium]